jgi:hypothetical protein
MITFNKIGDHGRFGNQLFQYALLRGVEAKNGHKARIPVHSKANPHLLHLLQIPEERFHRGPVPARRIYREGPYYFNPQVFSVKDGTDFYGYFQTEKYFEHVATELHDEMMPSVHYQTLAMDRIASARSKFGAKPVVVIHMRRGDNVHGGGMDPAEHAKFIPCQPLTYYHNAIAYLREQLGPCSFIVLSNTPDDAKWSEENFPLDDALYFGGPEEDPLVDFATMVAGDHLVISNSTMSWWAGWLGEKEGKLNIYPTLWFGPKYVPPKHDLKDLWPQRPNWVRVESF